MTLEWNFDYGELINDEDFFGKCENLKEHLVGIQKVLDEILPLKEKYDELSGPSQIELDLVLAFTLNCLYWINLRLKGVDTTTHPIKGEIQRIKAAMVSWQQAKDRENRPKVNINAAKRFVRSGLYDHNQTKDGAPPNKKIKFDDTDV